MNNIERMNCVFNGVRPDRTPFVPSIYEHGAAVLKKTPSAVSVDARLMAEAAIESFSVYDHDLATVGIDIYNVEAEAFGCRVTRFEDDSIPAISHHPLAEDEEPALGDLKIPDLNGSNRLRLIAEACRIVRREIGDHVWVYGCMSGPFSQAVELRGFEQFLLDIQLRPSVAHSLLEKTAALSTAQAESISKQGVGVNIYESWATLPLISPEIFKEFVIPYNKRIMREIRTNFRTNPPALIMGGNISALIDFFIDAGATLVAADHKADLAFIRKRLSDHGSKIVIRGCVNPQIIERGEWETLDSTIRRLADNARGMFNFVWGCGCVSFTTTKENLLRFKDACRAASARSENV
jgi:uroporphyrinogen decarboxylase